MNDCRWLFSCLGGRAEGGGKKLATALITMCSSVKQTEVNATIFCVCLINWTGRISTICTQLKDLECFFCAFYFNKDDKLARVLNAMHPCAK